MTDSPKLATLVRHLHHPSSTADQRLYRLDPPIVTDRWDYDTETERTVSVRFVITSAIAVSHSGPETYIFAGDSDGEITDWIELPGSFRGDLDHEEALRRAGYEVSA